MNFQIVFVGLIFLFVGSIGLTMAGKKFQPTEDFLRALNFEKRADNFHVSATWGRIGGVLLLIMGVVIIGIGLSSKLPPP
ncbi:hypothetical protein ETAA8_07620 [Anatilimnocola aggregata]|uniref:Uncharacterized protein n=1 Tax=Anatilimnocola aggregata TaxID=2528021 RepID=A0A517Y6D8_9BACT|nr:hypothetical protein [Anatilimnocola aggregata]QDU25692.1 hypothetical protein ETAA8_07620 [Anatilimnocola aggregata]